MEVPLDCLTLSPPADGTLAKWAAKTLSVSCCPRGTRGGRSWRERVKPPKVRRHKALTVQSSQMHKIGWRPMLRKHIATHVEVSLWFLVTHLISRVQYQLRTSMFWASVDICCSDVAAPTGAALYGNTQDSHGDGKPGKVLEFQNAIFQAWKSLGIFLNH